MRLVKLDVVSSSRRTSYLVMIELDYLPCRALQSGLSRLVSDSDEVRLESSEVGVGVLILMPEATSLWTFQCLSDTFPA